MTTTLLEVEEKIRTLNGAEKRQLLAQLIAELDEIEEGLDPAAIEADWLVEAERRRSEVLDGTVKVLTEEQVFAEARANLRR